MCLAAPAAQFLRRRFEAGASFCVRTAPRPRAIEPIEMLGLGNGLCSVRRHVGRIRRTWERVINGEADANLDFDDVITLLMALGFRQRVRGSHHALMRPKLDRPLTLQRAGNKAKPYQVRQVRAVILAYNLDLEV